MGHPIDTIPSRRRIFLLGPSGSGKTVIAKQLAPEIDYDLIDTDRVVLKTSNYHTITDIFRDLGEPAFRSLEQSVINSILDADQKAVVATGGGLPEIPGMMDILNANGLTVYLKAGLGTLWQRLTAEPRELLDRPLLQQQGEEQLRTLLRRREPIYTAAHVVLKTDSLTVKEVCAALHGILCKAQEDAK